jgi:hypothetical protein
MPNDKLTLTIESRGESEHVSLADFVAQLDGLRAALERTDASLNGGQQTIEWEVVGLSHSSPATVELEARPRGRPAIPKARPDDVIRAFSDNVRALSERKAPAPHLDYAAVNAYRSLGSPVGSGRITATVSTPYETLRIEPEIESTAANVLDEDMITESAYKGLLEYLNIHGTKNEFRIYPPAGPNYVTCQFDEDQLGQAKAAVGHPVRVYGRLIYKARSAFPYRIEVERIQVLPSDDKIPGLMSLRGLAPHATGELASEDFVRSVRDAS